MSHQVLRGLQSISGTVLHHMFMLTKLGESMNLQLDSWQPDISAMTLDFHPTHHAIVCCDIL